MAKKIDVIKLAEKRNKKMEQANSHFIKMRKLEADAEAIDMQISEHCDHPKEYLKLKYFTNEKNALPQKTMWLCTLCYQAVDFDQEKREKRLNKALIHLEEAFEEVPQEKVKYTEK